MRLHSNRRRWASGTLTVFQLLSGGGQTVCLSCENVSQSLQYDLIAFLHMLCI